MEIDHRVQLLILKQLLFNPKAKFSELNTTQLTNDHFTFHLKRLVELGLVKKNNDYYQLTTIGLETASRLDIKSLTIKKQPKVGVLLCITRTNNNQQEVLLGERLKDPNKGQIGFHAEKVIFGESLFETAKRCLLKETGLSGSLSFAGTVHLLDKDRNNPQYDRLMCYFRVSNIKGKLVEKTTESRNFWLSYEEAYRQKNIFADLPQDLDLFNKKELFFK